MATKESKEVVAFISGLASAIADAKSDGIVDWTDARFAVPLANLATDAVKGSDGIIEELKNITGEDMDALVKDMVSAITALVYAVMQKGG